MWVTFLVMNKSCRSRGLRIAQNLLTPLVMSQSQSLSVLGYAYLRAQSPKVVVAMSCPDLHCWSGNWVENTLLRLNLCWPETCAILRKLIYSAHFLLSRYIFFALAFSSSSHTHMSFEMIISGPINCSHIFVSSDKVEIAAASSWGQLRPKRGSTFH